VSIDSIVQQTQGPEVEETQAPSGKEKGKKKKTNKHGLGKKKKLWLKVDLQYPRTFVGDYQTTTMFWGQVGEYFKTKFPDTTRSDDSWV